MPPATPLKKERTKRPLRQTDRTPARRALAHSSITASTKDKLYKLDSGRCLITFEKMPTASQQASHIVPQRTPKGDLKEIANKWGVSSLNLDSIKNLVTLLRADWYLSYTHGDWTFVPSERTLRKILKYKGSTFDKPYAGFDPDGLQEYVFVPLASLRQRYILRRIAEFDQDQHDEGGDADELEDEIEGDEQELESEKQEVATYTHPFLDFPNLKHHAHPFYVIYRALPNMRKHWSLLPPEHMGLFALMTEIDANWILRECQSPKPDKRRRLSQDDDGDDDPPQHMTRAAAKRLKTRETLRKTNASKGKANAKGHGKKVPAQPPESTFQSPNVKTPSDVVFLSDHEIAAWAAAVAAAGSPEVIDEAVTWPDHEPVRSPIRRWDKWHVPYNQPKEWSRFCSSDWPMYFYSYSLWMPYNGK